VLKLAIWNEDLEMDYKWLGVDIRPAVGEGQEFELVLKAPAHRLVEIKAEGLEAFPDDQVVLIDVSLVKFYNLHERRTLQLQPQEGYSDYRVVVGDAEYIAEMKEKYLPQRYWLSQNYPNPFNPETSIEYILPVTHDGGLVRLVVYDLLGQKVRTLVHSLQSSGIYRVWWDGKDDFGRPAASSVYFYQLTAREYIQTKKMVLLK